MEYLSREEFTQLWVIADKKMERILDSTERQVALQTQTNLHVAERMATLEVKQEECARDMGRRTTLISSIVSACVGALTSTLLRWRP